MKNEFTLSTSNKSTKASNKSKETSNKKEIKREKVEMIEDQLDIDDMLDKQVDEADEHQMKISLVDSIVEVTGCNPEVAQASIDNAKQKNANNIKSYAIASINKGFTISKPANGINPMKFNNFEARDYDYLSLERKLLGWDDENLESEEKTISLTEDMKRFNNNPLMQDILGITI